VFDGFLSLFLSVLGVMVRMSNMSVDTTPVSRFQQSASNNAHLINLPSYDSDCDDVTVTEPHIPLDDFFRVNTTSTTTSTTATRPNDYSINERLKTQAFMDFQFIYCAKTRAAAASFCPNNGCCMDLITIPQALKARAEYAGNELETTKERQDKYFKLLKQAHRDTRDNFHFQLISTFLRSQGDHRPLTNNHLRPTPPLFVCEQVYLQLVGAVPPFGLMEKNAGRGRAPRGWRKARQEIIDGITPAMKDIEKEMEATLRENGLKHDSCVEYIQQIMERYSDDSPLPGTNNQWHLITSISHSLTFI